MAGFIDRVASFIGVTNTPKIQPSKGKTFENNININFSQNRETSIELEQAILSDIERMADIPE